MAPAYTPIDLGVARRWPEKAIEAGAEWILIPANGGKPCCVNHAGTTVCDLEFNIK
jgi:hypothetical protein